MSFGRLSRLSRYQTICELGLQLTQVLGIPLAAERRICPPTAPTVIVVRIPTILSHPAVSLALVPWLRRCPPSLFVLAAICSALPDVDVLAFSLGIPYVHPLGHRGVTHSLGFAVLAAALAGLLYVRLVRSAVSFRVAFALLAGSFISHGVLDAMTSGGEGVGFLIPFSSERFFFPWRPIRVSPIGIGFFSKAGVVLGSEVRYVWAPAAAVGVIGLLRRSAARARGEKPGHHE